MKPKDQPSDPLAELLQAAREDGPRADLGEQVLAELAYRARLEQTPSRPPAPRRPALWLAGPTVLVALAVLLAVRLTQRALAPEASIAAEASGRTSSSSEPGRTAAAGSVNARPAGASSAVAPAADPCRDGARALGLDPRIDDFEDGDDAVQALEGRAGFWRWARETDAPGTAPALIPIPRPEPLRSNRLALHVKGGQLVDWGATVELDFRPSCYDASAYGGVGFRARGPGRIYVAPREVSVIPIAEGGTCDHDCHNPHVKSVDLDATWRTYRVHWSDVRQRGAGKPPLDPQRLHSLAFLIRPEDTPYDVWLDDVHFIAR
ncbi:MAG: hypothetical protein ABI548_15620 [Polyangiaceae bacterium]